MTTRRIKVRVPVIALVRDGQEIRLDIGWRGFTLKTPDNYDSRCLAVALQAARSVILEIDENPHHPVPEDIP